MSDCDESHSNLQKIIKLVFFVTIVQWDKIRKKRRF